MKQNTVRFVVISLATLKIILLIGLAYTIYVQHQQANDIKQIKKIAEDFQKAGE